MGPYDNNFTSNNKLQNCDKLSSLVLVNMPVRFSQSVFSTCTDCVYTHTLPFCCILKLPLKHIRIQNVTYHLPFYYNLLLFIPMHFPHTLSYHPLTDVTVLIQLLYEYSRKVMEKVFISSFKKQIKLRQKAMCWKNWECGRYARQQIFMFLT